MGKKKIAKVTVRFKTEQVDKIQEAAKRMNGGNISGYIRKKIIAECKRDLSENNKERWLRPYVKPFIWDFIKRAYSDENYIPPDDSRREGDKK